MHYAIRFLFHSPDHSRWFVLVISEWLTRVHEKQGNGGDDGKGWPICLVKSIIANPGVGHRGLISLLQPDEKQRISHLNLGNKKKAFLFCSTGSHNWG